MKTFITLNQAPWRNPTGYIISDKPRYLKTSRDAWRALDGLVMPNGTFYVTMGYPSRYDCLVYCLEIPSWKVVGYDRRSREIVEAERGGMGVVMTPPPKVDPGGILSVCTSWAEVASSIPDEDFGDICEWHGSDYAPREFVFKVYDSRGNPDAIMDVCRRERIVFVKPHAGRDYVEILHPTRAHFRILAKAGFTLYKDWTKVEVF